MGNIKTKKRNRLSIRKTRDCTLIKGELRRQHAKERTARLRLKRQFGNKVAQQLIQAVEDDSDESDVGEEPEEPVVSFMTLALTGTSKIDWSVEAGWDEFWGDGVKHHTEEMIFYDLLTRASSEEGQDRSTGNVGTNQEPISL
ncbi:hypothetical protein F5887DRAFT_918145 [Amanita rubescens]|nr:hypothetical protein F5887DRAFT_918145 [Amanita rubescens]